MSQSPRLIEDYLPIEAISKEASREKRHISGIHLWWARRPLVACRAAVYGALVPASRFEPKNGPEEKRRSLGRANAAKFVERLCKYPGDPKVIKEAEQHILEAHAERLSAEQGKTITVEDIREGRAPRPKVLDMFAGGGAIPLEALRLGCEAYAMDLNPVAYIIELCTLVYPQKYGKPDPNARGMTGPKNAKGETTWGGLADEVRHWGNWVLERVKAEIGDLYPPIPDPAASKTKVDLGKNQVEMASGGFQQKGQQVLAEESSTGFLTPVAYLWTRTVACKNPACGATVPLVRQTWLCKKEKRYAALRMIAPKGERRVRFEVVEAATEAGLGFDPAAFSKGGNATCPFCGTVADSAHVKAEGCAGRMAQQMMAIVCTRPTARGKIYLSADDYRDHIPDDEAIRKQIEVLCHISGLTIPNEQIAGLSPKQFENTLGIGIRPYGYQTFADLFSDRQKACLIAFAYAIRQSSLEIKSRMFVSEIRNVAVGDTDPNRIVAISTYLAAVLDKVADYSSLLCSWHSGNQQIRNTFGMQALPMVWDSAETNPLGGSSGSWQSMIDSTIEGMGVCLDSSDRTAQASRGTASHLPYIEHFFEAVVTDPPYYDNVPYSDISDYFYVWLKRSIGPAYPEHFVGDLTPKRTEAIADPQRHGGSKPRARAAYESMMLGVFSEARRVLADSGLLVVIYAHKTTIGWATLIDALRRAGFIIMEAWPLDTEMKSRLRFTDSSALASNIFLVARKQEGARTGSYETEVRPQLEEIVRERVETLWEMGIAGADLVIAAVGAGLKAYTQFARVEKANGEEMPAEGFLAEVEGVVLSYLLEKIFKVSRSGVEALDGPTRFYVLWRYAYGNATLDAGEAIVMSYGQPVELDGPRGLSAGSNGLLEKKKGSYRLRDFTERGKDEGLGLSDGNNSASLIDILHRVLWLVENHPRALKSYLDQATPNTEHLRLVAQALAGPALKGNVESADALITTTTAEQSALGKLLANWRSLVETGLFSGTTTPPQGNLGV
ncbi:MAG: DUF1156 domain-containing protein [bacterium]